MKKFISILFFCFVCLCLQAQTNAPDGYEWADSLIYTPMSAMDESLEGRNIFTAMPENVTVNQNAAIRDSLISYIHKNQGRSVSGYRIRIFFDNKQNSRGASEAEAARFRSLYPGYSVYRSFANPFFKVTIGDFRTKSEANTALRVIVNDFPTAFVVREKFRFPALDPKSYTVDTVKVLRKIEEL